MMVKVRTAKVGIVTLGVLLSAALCRAEGTCPWINTATVIDAPDSAVSDVQSSVANDGNMCVFHYRKADRLYSVQITIHTTVDAIRGMAADETQCQSNKMALAHIGNEAVLCSTSAHGERLIGRVRDQIFMVNVDVKTKQSSADLNKSLGDMATMMAAQVAGNLF